MADRRTFLRGLAALPLIGGGVTATAAITTPDVGALWRRRQLAQGAEVRAFSFYEDARARLPWWAKPGPSFVDHRGAFRGDESNLPALKIYTVPEHAGAWRRIRIGPAEIERRYELRLMHASEAIAREARHRDQADFEARLAKRGVEEEALGIPALSETHDDAFDALVGINDAIESLPDGSANVTATKILIHLHREAGVNETAAASNLVGLAAVALRGLLPQLGGELAIDVADVLADPKRPVRDMRISRGTLPDGSLAAASPV